MNANDSQSHTTTEIHSTSPQQSAYAQMIDAAQSASSLHHFFIAILRIILQALQSPYASIEIRLASEVISEDAHGGSDDPKFWKKPVHTFLTESLTHDRPHAKILNPKRGNTKIAFIACPILGPGDERMGTIAIVVPCRQADEIPRHVATLNTLIQCATGAISLIHQKENRTSTSTQNNQALARIGQITTPHELAFNITNSLRNKLNCEQVAIGFVKKRRVHILSISGIDHVAKQSTGVRCIKSAMEECYDANEIILAAGQMDRRTEETVNYRLHEEWQTVANGDSVASIPLQVNDQPLAVLSIRRRSGDTLTRDQLADIKDRVEAYVPALLLARRAARSVTRHAIDSVAEVTTKLFTAGNWGTKLLTASFALFIGWCAFGQMNHNITVPCIIAPAVVRHVATPFDGMLESVETGVGDVVTAGHILARFDQQELRRQRAVLAAEIEVLDTRHDRALAEDNRVEARLSQANQRLLQSRLQLIESRIEQSIIRAPIDGMIIAGDIEDQIGNMLDRGHPLFKIAPPDQWNVELRIPESEATYITSGLTGRFIPFARPETSERITVTRIRPAALVDKERNVFVAEAQGNLPYDWLRPGMEGTANIDAGKKPVWWIMFHRIIDAMRVRFWL